MEKPHDKPAPERFDEKAIEPRDDVRVHGAGGLRCPFCHDGVDIDAVVPWVACEQCLARHHEACWTEAGRCGGCGHDVALAGRLRPPSGAQPGDSRALPVLLAVVALSLLILMGGGVFFFTLHRGGAAKEAEMRAFVDAHNARAEAQRRAELEEQTRKLEEAQRMFVNQAEATKAAVELAEGGVGGPRRVEVVGGHAVVDAKGAWIFVDTTGGGVRLLAAGIGTTFLEAAGPEVTCAQPGGVPYSVSKGPGPPGTVIIVEGSGPANIMSVTPAQRDAIVSALQAPPSEVDIAALLKDHGYVRREQR